MVQNRTAGRRDRIDIILSILRVLGDNGPSSKTSIMRFAELNSKSFEEYVEGLLVLRGFVEKRKLRDRYVYVLTPSGRMLHTLLSIVRDLLYIEEPRDAKILRELLINKLQLRGFMVSSYLNLGDGLMLPVDIAVSHNGSTVVVNVAATRSSALCRLALSALAATLGGANAFIAVPARADEIYELVGKISTSAIKPLVYEPSSIERSAEEIVSVVEDSLAKSFISNVAVKKTMHVTNIANLASRDTMLVEGLSKDKRGNNGVRRVTIS